jgi:endonuclease/exonuclease/phosphatase family metal-dependent hydrolase
LCRIGLAGHPSTALIRIFSVVSPPDEGNFVVVFEVGKFNGVGQIQGARAEYMVRFKDLMTRSLCALLLGILIASGSSAQLRIVNYNTATAQATGGVQTARRPHSDLIFEAIGLDNVNGLARPVDVLLLQEQFNMGLTTQSFVDVLNDIYDPINRTMYARSTVNGQISNTFNGSGGRPGLIYNTQTIELIAETQVGTVGTASNQQPRASMRYQLRPVGYEANADFYAFSAHWSASLASQRLAEAQAIRTNADALPDNSHVIYSGDFNITSSNVQSYQHMVSAGDAQAVDPLNKPGIWGDRQFIGAEDIRYLHTQSPAADGEGIPGYAESGMDDRYDFQLVTAELLDGEGLSMLPNSYHVFGNNGTHDFSGSITTGTGAAAPILAALKANSDHLPVVADYQLPANMFASLEAAPSLVGLGETVGIDALIQNVANVLNANWADELDYTLNVSGSLIGGASGTLVATAPANVHEIFLNTSSLGSFNGTVTISTASQGAANSLYEFPVSFSVIDFLQADFNRDGDVDAEDLIEWQAGYGVNADGDADFDDDTDGRDFLIWQRQFGQTSLPLEAGSLAAVPEPSSMLLLMASAALCLAYRRPVMLG